MKDKQIRESEATVSDAGVNPWSGCYHTPLQNISPDSLLMRSCFSLSDGENRIELESGKFWSYYNNQLIEYLEAFEIEGSPLADNWTITIVEMMAFFGGLVHTPVFFFWIEDTKQAPEQRRIWK